MTKPALIGAPTLGDTLEGGYVLRRVLGVGGMGVVYEASGPDGQRVAVKVRRPDPKGGPSDSASTMRRFELESSLPSAANSPHIVPTLHTGFDAQRRLSYFVMPLLVGLDLKHQIHRLVWFHPVLAVRVVRQICAGLEQAHEASVIHRDIKPANIFLDHDPQGRVVARVLDFGVAKDLSSSAALTHSREVLGTPTYMSPEQIRAAKNVDARTDLWSLGVILYELLVGKRPFLPRSNLATMFVAICADAIPHIQDAAPWIEPGLAEIVHGCLIRDRQMRCPSAGELARVLQPFAAGSDELRASDFVAPDPSLFSGRPARATLPRAWSPSEAPAPARSALETTIGSTTPDPWLGAVLGKGYTLLHRLGTGGMGAVYEALGPDDNRYAVKVLEFTSDGGARRARQRLQREALAAMKVQSPHVVQVFEACADESSEVPFIVMELLKGYDLGELIKRKRPLQPAVVARLFVQACRGLAEAHAMGFVHRDIKPSNLFLQYLPSGHLTVKVCDFGLVKVVGRDELVGSDGTLTVTSQLLGTPQYMSPEQAKGADDLDQRTDLWSLGMSLFHALAGKHPWSKYGTAGEFIVAICTEQVPRLDGVAPWVPSGLADVVDRALQRPPDARFSSAESLAAALEPFVGGYVDVHVEDLTAIPESARDAGAGHVPGALELAGATSHSDATETFGSAKTHDLSGSAAQGGPRRWSRRRTTAAVISAIGLLGLGGLVGWGLLGADGGQPPAELARPLSTVVRSLSVPARPSSSAPHAHHVSVRVVPPDAQVSVDGNEHPVEDGVLKLSGEPGDTFDVVLRSGALKESVTVVITKQGTAKPDRIALRSGPRPLPATGARPGGADRSKQWQDTWQ